MITVIIWSTPAATHIRQRRTTVHIHATRVTRRWSIWHKVAAITCPTWRRTIVTTIAIERRLIHVINGWLARPRSRALALRY